mgnify:CR=1 FL=1
MDTDINIQVWGLNDTMQDSFGPLGDSEWALDPANRRTSQSRFREVTQDGRFLRVLSVPLGYGGDQIAVMQVAVPLDAIESARTYLLYVLFVIWLYGVIIVGFALYLTLGRALEPLKSIVETAELVWGRPLDVLARHAWRGSDADGGVEGGAWPRTT